VRELGTLARCVAAIKPHCTNESLGVPDGCGSYAIAFPDLFHRELAPANTASPARGRRLRASWYRALISASGRNEFATALRTLSLNHTGAP
jgi:hypothetical protein